MKKLAVTLISIAIAATLLLVTIAILHPEVPSSPLVNGYYLSSGNYQDSGNLTAAEKLEAARLAAYSDAEKDLLEYLQAHKYTINKTIGDVTAQGPYYDGFFSDRREGYLNSSVKLAYVPIHIDAVSTINPRIRADHLVLVDLAGGKVLGWGEYPWGRATSIARILPPDDYWFVPLTSGYGLSGHISLIYTPADARLSTMVVDRENFDRFSSGTAYNSTAGKLYFQNDYRTVRDMGAEEQISPQGTYKGASTWFADISVSPIQPDGSFLEHRELYYLILHNEDESGEVKVLYDFT